MAKTKGIRVSDLAKELGVSAKGILHKLVEEQIPDAGGYKVSSALGVGLAETVRGWATAGELSRADDSHGGVAVAERPKRSSVKRKKSDADYDPSVDAHDVPLDDQGNETSIPHDDLAASFAEPAPLSAEPADEAAAVQIPAEEATQPGAAEAEPAFEAPVMREVPTEPDAPIAPGASNGASTPEAARPAPSFRPAAAKSAGPNVVRKDAPVVSKSAGSGLAMTLPPPSTRPKPPAAPARPPVTAPRPAAAAPAAPPPPAAPLTAPPSAGAAAATTGPVPAVGPGAAPPRGQPVMRPTVSINDQGGARQAIAPPPRMVAPAKLALKGPQVIREEKPDIVAAPRKRVGPGGASPNGPSPAFQQARTVGGRGVKAVAGPEEESEEAKKKAKARGGVGRRGPDGRRGQADEKLKEFTEADLIERRDRLLAAAKYVSGVNSHIKREQRRGMGGSIIPSKSFGPILVEEPITPKSLGAATGLKVNEIISKLMKQGVFATINQPLDVAVAQAIALEFGIEIEAMKPQTLEDLLMVEFDSREREEANLVIRPPVVTILGHVDHGKTSLLDKIRSANVAAGEAGGITQHIAAFSVEMEKDGDKKRVTFIDTPGHQAFTSMRARGANMTDVVVLVVDAAQGVQPQTIESINHARAAGVPIVIALNKIDLPEANPDMVMGQLASHDLSPVAWGGQTEMIKTSGRTGEGIADLIEILDLQAQILELKADPTSPARGVVIEARVDPGLGSVATVLVQDGTLRVGDVILAGQGYGRVRSLTDSLGKFIQQAGPSQPVLVAGLSLVPSAGDKFFTLDDLDRARQIAEDRVTTERQMEQASQGKVTLEGLFGQMKEGLVKTINLIVKGDVQGSVETLEKTVTDHNTDEVKVKVIHSAVGPINESDIELASASDAVVIGFNVVPEPAAQALSEQRRVEVRTYRVIYEIFDDLKKALSGMLAPEVREKHHGWVEVRQVFKVSKVGNVAGCYITEGHLSRGSKIRLVRDGNVITENLTIETLRRVKDDVKEVKQGFECGIKLANYDDIKVGDKLEGYIREEFKRTL